MIAAGILFFTLTGLPVFLAYRGYDIRREVSRIARLSGMLTGIYSSCFLVASLIGETLFRFDPSIPVGAGWKLWLNQWTNMTLALVSLAIAIGGVVVQSR